MSTAPVWPKPIARSAFMRRRFSKARSHRILLMPEEIHWRRRQRRRWTQRTLVNHLQSRDEVVRQRKRGRRLHAHPARYLRNEVVAIVGENAPGVVDSAKCEALSGARL